MEEKGLTFLDVRKKLRLQVCLLPIEHGIQGWLLKIAASALLFTHGVFTATKYNPLFVSVHKGDPEKSLCQIH